MALSTQTAVDVEQGIGDGTLRRTLTNHAAQNRHGLVVGGTGLAHELLLLGVLNRTGMIDGGRTQDKPAGSARVAQGKQEPSGEVLVATQGSRMVGEVAHKRKRVVLVSIAPRGHGKLGGSGEQVVHHKHRISADPQNESVEPLSGIDIETRKPADAQGVAHEHLGKTQLIEVATHLLKAVCIVCRHDTPFSLSFRICVRLFS